jgi:hypothetical protein
MITYADLAGPRIALKCDFIASVASAEMRPGCLLLHGMSVHRHDTVPRHLRPAEAYHCTETLSLVYLSQHESCPSSSPEG